MRITMVDCAVLRTRETEMQDIKAAGKRTAQEAQATREKIVSAALERFSAGGFESVSVRGIAADAGVTHGMIQHHFGGKQEVWKAAMEEVFDRYRQSLLPEIDQAPEDQNPLETFRKVVTAFIQLSSDQPTYARLLVRESEAGGERARFCFERFQEIHQAIGRLFEQARQHSPALQFHTNDSFFNALMSLTFFGILHPSAGIEPQYPLKAEIRDRTDLILAILFGHPSRNPQSS